MGQVIGTSVASQTLKAARIGDSDSIYKLVQADRTRALRAADQGSGFTALHYACRYGHTAVVWVLLQEDAPTEVVCKAGWTALHWACGGGHKQCVELLLDTEANPRAFTERGNGATPLHLAAVKGHAELVELLVENCAKVDAPTKPVRFTYSTANNKKNKGKNNEIVGGSSNHDGQTALQWAAAAGHVSTVAALLGTPPGSCADPNCVPQTGGLSGLHEATGAGHTEVMDLLLAAGADLEARDYRGFTPLIWSCVRKQSKAASLLLRAGADVHARDDCGESALDWAIWKGSATLVEVLLAAGAFYRPANFDRSMHQDGSTVKATACGLESGPEDPRGYSPMHRAALKGDARGLMVISTLLKGGVEVNLSDNIRGETALHWAAWRGLADVVSALLEGGADINAQTNTGDTALHLAAHNAELEVCRRLLTKGADLQLLNKDRCTALQVAENGASAHDIKEGFVKSSDDKVLNEAKRTAPQLEASVTLGGANLRGFLHENGPINPLSDGEVHSANNCANAAADDATSSSTSALDHGGFLGGGNWGRVACFLRGETVPPPDPCALAKGSRVRWKENDEDIPMGDEGTVVGFQLDSRGRRRAQVTFSYGPFALLCSDLIVVAPPAPAPAESRE